MGTLDVGAGEGQGAVVVDAIEPRPGVEVVDLDSVRRSARSQPISGPTTARIPSRCAWVDGSRMNSSGQSGSVHGIPVCVVQQE